MPDRHTTLPPETPHAASPSPGVNSAVDATPLTLAKAHHADFLARADSLDKDGEFPHENITEMQHSGLLQMAMPKRFGGHDASFGDIAAVLHEIATACPSTALIFNMHLAFTYQLAYMWRRDEAAHWTQWLTRISDGNFLVGGALSESMSWNGVLYPQTRAVQTDTGYRINGSRSFCTGSHHLDLIQCTARLTAKDGAAEALYFILPKDSAGLHWKDDWNTLGMRASASQGFTLENVTVPADNVVYRYAYGQMDVSPIWLSFLAASFIGFASVYSGIADHAYTYAAERIRTRQRAPGSHGLIHKPSVQRHAGAAQVKIETMRAVREAIAARYAIDRDLDLMAIVDTAIAKQVSIESAIETVEHAISLLGGQAYFKSLRLERLLRDVRAGPFHPFSPDDSLDMLGKLNFGLNFMEPPGWAL